jgi:hypothetical protein
LWLTSVLVDGFAVDGLVALISASVLIWLINQALELGEWVYGKRTQSRAGST